MCLLSALRICFLVAVKFDCEQCNMLPWSQNFTVPEDLSAYDGIELRVKGDGKRYKLIVRTSFEWDTVGYTASFDTTKGELQSVSCIMV